MVKELLVTREKYNICQDERKVILIHLGVNLNEENDLDFIGTFRKYVVNNEERVQGQREQITELEDMVREKSVELQNTANHQGLCSIESKLMKLKTVKWYIGDFSISCLAATGFRQYNADG